MPIMKIIAGNPVSWIMIAPSVTPKRTNGGSNNPAMRLYKFETDTGQVSIIFVICYLIRIRMYSDTGHTSITQYTNT